MIKVKLSQIANTRSGDKGPDSNVGVIFNNKKIYNWALSNLTTSIIKNHFADIVKGDVIKIDTRSGEYLSRV